jgi:hypothetical protein
MLVSEHGQHAHKLAAGPAIPAESSASCAATQAMWRFLAHDQVTLAALVEPLRDYAHKNISPEDEYVLSVIDWSKIDYKNHTAKTDVTQLTHKNDIGYELTTQLLINSKTGQPIAPVQMHLKYADGYLTTAKTPIPDEHRLNQILPLMEQAEEMKFPVKLVTVIDREADALLHFRKWSKKKHLFLVRSRNSGLLNWQEKQLKCQQISEILNAEGAFKQSREITVKGKKCLQTIAEAAVVLDRPASRKVDGMSIKIEGEPLQLRLVISKILDKTTGKNLGEWYLLTNVEASVPAATIALWYYYRWTIESYFKLMKSGGQELEHWQQESAMAIFKRLLIASMAVTAVWEISASETPEAIELKQVFTRLSGKARKPGRPPTKGILLSGLLVFLQMYDFLESINYDLTKIEHYRQVAIESIPALTQRLV